MGKYKSLKQTYENNETKLRNINEKYEVDDWKFIKRNMSLTINT